MTTLNIFTIVLNGRPWIEKAARAFLEADPTLLDWRWTVVHGVADPVADTGWCRHIEAPQDDGTLALLERWSAQHPDRIRIIKQERWPGKTAMCNAALDTFTTPGVLLQMDADEVWTTEQLRVIASLFWSHPGADGALFLCRYWVGPRRYICERNTFGNHLDYEWIRAWAFRPGMRFEAHEPPKLEGATRFIPHDMTARLGLVFDHFAYATREQVEFKERYYGYAGAVEAWDRLQRMRGAVDLCGVLPWVRSRAISHDA